MTQKELENETKPEREACYTHRSKELSRVFFFLSLFCRLAEREKKKLEKEGDKGRVGEMQVLLSETASAAPSLPA